MALSCEPLIKRFKAKQMDTLSVAEVAELDWQGALILLGYDPAEMTEEKFLKSQVKTLLKNAPRNKENRDFGMGEIKRWAIQMGKGLWTQNGQPMGWDTVGQIVFAQHRLGALLLLTQWWLKKKLPSYMKDFRKAPTIPAFLVFNISRKKHVADTADIGKPRKLIDLVWRNDMFGKVDAKDKKRMGTALAVAARLVWLRAGGRSVRNGPKFDEAEGLNFVTDADKHPELVKTVKFIDDLNSNGSGSIENLITLGYASGLCYLMTVSQTAYGGALDFGASEQAENFWAEFAKSDGHAKGSPILALRDYYTQDLKKATRDRDATVNAAIKAWDAYLQGRDDVKWTDLKTKKGEMFHVGGIDISKEERIRYDNPEAETEETEEPPTEPVKAAPTKKAPKAKAAKSKPAKAKPETQTLEVPEESQEEEVIDESDDENPPADE